MIFIRISGIAVTAPFFGSVAIPKIAKIGLFVFMSIIVATSIATSYPISIETSPGIIALLAMKNFFIGFSIGVAALIPIAAAQLAGVIFGFQIGYGFVFVADPINSQQQSILGIVMFNVAFLIFVGLGGDKLIVSSIIDSFQKLPLNTVTLSREGGLQVAQAGIYVFEKGVQIGMPIIGFLLIISLILGILARLMPQMNIFMVGMPLKIVVGLFILIILIPVWGEIIGKAVFYSQNIVKEIFVGFR
jgi:flagellar biosynthetic protein FliR